MYIPNTHVIKNSELYNNNTKGTIAGEGVSMFLLNNNEENAIAKIELIKTINTNNEIEVAAQLKLILKNKNIDVLITGENSDNRLQKYFEVCENIVNANTLIVRYKHFCGEFPTASAISLWLACEFITNQNTPAHFIKRKSTITSYNNILIYNNYKGEQHSFILVTDVTQRY